MKRERMAATNKTLLRGALSMVLSLSMILGSVLGGRISMVVHADPAPDKTVTGLGTGAISDPVVPESKDSAWSGSYVYYGSNNAQPVKYRVLDAATELFGGNTMFLDCDSVLFTSNIRSDADAEDANIWSESNLKKILNTNEDSFLNTGFTAVEKTAIAESTVAEHELASFVTGYARVWLGREEDDKQYYTPLNGERIFLLDVEDVLNPAYGYCSDCGWSDGWAVNHIVDNHKKCNSISGYDSIWWLRSPSSVDSKYAGYVYDEGYVYYADVSSDYGVSPALNVDLSSVIFSSLITGTAGEAGAEYKLTIADDDLGIATGAVTREGKTVTVPYTISGNNAEKATQVSVLVTDSEYSAGTTATTGYTYRKLAVDSWSTSGTGTFTLPDEYADKNWGSDYHVYVLAEDVNGDKETDYASIPVEIKAITASATGYDGAYDGQAHGITVSVTDPASGATVKYGESADSCTLDASPTITNISDSPKTIYYQVAADGYITTTGSAVVKISNPSPAITAIPTARAITYGNVLADSPLSGGTATAMDGTELEGSFTWTENTIKPAVSDSNTTEYEVTFTPSDTTRYATATCKVKLKVNPKSVTISGITAKNKTYDGNTTATLDYTGVTFNGKFNDDTLSVTATGTFADAAVGDNKTVNISNLALGGASAANYVLASNGQQTSTAANIKKAANPATVTDTASVIKGGNKVDLSANVSLNGATGAVSYEISGDSNGCTLNGSELTSGTNKGSVIINVTVAADGNYEALAATPITVTITDKATQTPSFASSTLEKTYGDADFTVTVTGAETNVSYAITSGDAATVDSSTGKVHIVMAGTVAITATAEETTEYVGASASYTLTINRKAATVKADDKTMVYGAPEPKLTATVTGVVGSDTVAYSMSRVEGTAVGTYIITPTGDATQGNYTVTYETGTFTITKKADDKPTATAKEKGTFIKVANSKAEVVVTSKIGEEPTVAFSKADDTAKTVEVPETITDNGVTYKVTAIADRAFRGNKNLENVKLGDNITTLGKNTFENCPKLKSVTLSKNITKIPTGTFRNCKALKSVKLDNVTEIGDGVFENCGSLKSLTIGPKATKIGKKAFKGTGVKTLIIKSSKLTKKSVKGSLSGSKVKTIKVKVGNKKQNKAVVKNYKKIFNKKIAGRKVTVK